MSRNTDLSILALTLTPRPYIYPETFVVIYSHCAKYEHPSSKKKSSRYKLITIYPAFLLKTCGYNP